MWHWGEMTDCTLQQRNLRFISNPGILPQRASQLGKKAVWSIVFSQGWKQSVDLQFNYCRILLSSKLMTKLIKNKETLIPLPCYFRASNRIYQISLSRPSAWRSCFPKVLLLLPTLLETKFSVLQYPGKRLYWQPGALSRTKIMQFAVQGGLPKSLETTLLWSGFWCKSLSMLISSKQQNLQYRDKQAGLKIVPP